MTVEISCSTRPRVGLNDGSDRCGWWKTAGRIVLAVVGGIEHGPGCAADTAIACIGARLDRSVEEAFAACDVRLRNMGGVSMAVAVIDRHSNRVTVASVGSVHCVLLIGHTDHHLACTKGVVGGGYSGLLLNTKILSSGDMLALYSDGLQEPFSLREALTKPPETGDDEASSVLKNWSDANTDVAVLLYRHEAAKLGQH